MNMKTRIFRTLTWGLLMAGLPLVGGCNQETGGLATNATALDKPALAAASQDGASPAAEAQPATAEAIPAVDKPVPPDNPVTTAKPLPANVKLTASATEVAKLAQAGLDDNVMLTYITNSAHTFNLGADQIVYLNDLGISSEVITAMIQHDQTLAGGGAWAGPAPTAPMPGPAQSQLASTATATAPAEVATAPASALAYDSASAVAPAEPVAQPQQGNVTYNYIYNSLAPYGSWVEVDGYGLCWQPTVTIVHADWRPYSDRGRWLYSDCGWYWQSDYSWGWAPFHYGRWFRHHRWGWCWWPDTIWAPSWVTWRYHDDYCGWAPLPPHVYYQPGFGFSYYGRSVGIGFNFGLAADWYTFVPFGRFCDYRPYRHRLPHHQVTQFFDRTTIINNIVKVRGNNNTVIINNGVVTDRVLAANKTEIRKAMVRDLPPTQGRGFRADRMQREGGSLVVYRPTPPNEPQLVRPATTSPATARPEGTAHTSPRVQSDGTRLSGQDQPRPAAVPAETRSARTPREVQPRNSVIVIGKRPEAKAGVQTPAAPTAVPPAPNRERAPNTDTGGSRVREPDRPANRFAPAPPNSSAVNPQRPAAPRQTPTISPGTPANRPATHFGTVRPEVSQPARTFERPAGSTPGAPQSVAPARMQPQVSPSQSSAPLRIHSAPAMPAAPRGPSVEARAPSAPPSPPAVSSPPSRSSAPSAERSERGGRDRQAR